MSEFRWTLDDLHKAERAFDRHRVAVKAGTYDVTEGGGSPEYDRACSECHARCFVIVGVIETIQHDSY